jgi:hypothetical protein
MSRITQIYSKSIALLTYLEANERVLKSVKKRARTRSSRMATQGQSQQLQSESFTTGSGMLIGWLGGTPLISFLKMAKRARDYKKEYADYHGKPEQIKRRAARNQSRQKLKDAGVDVAGKDVDHKDHNPKNMSKSNLRVRSVSANRADNGKRPKKK